MTGAFPRLIHGRDLRIEGEEYSVIIDGGIDGLVDRPFADLADRDGVRWTRLCLLASVDGGQAPLGVDETWRIEQASLDQVPDGSVLITLLQASTAWSSRLVLLRCTSDAVELSVTVTGCGRVRTVTMLGGAGRLPTGASGLFRSSIDVRSLSVPAPTEPIAFVRSAHIPAQIGVVGDADAGRLNAIFSPPPFSFGLGRGAVEDPFTAGPGEWLGISVRADIRECGFTAVRWEPLDGGSMITFDYEGQTAVEGEWFSPVVVLRPSVKAETLIADHRDDLIAHGFAPRHPPASVEPWWREPLFCGWGAQCAAAGGVSPALLARADHYDRWLGRLDVLGVRAGTIVVDDRWEGEYGSGIAAADRWPDLRAWISGQHRQGRRVVLWWKAWDAAAAPASECITTPDGVRLAVDPGSALYRQRLTATIAAMLSVDGLDADGLKIDFTQRAPSGTTLRRAEDASPGDGIWGVAALHVLLRTIYVAAKAAKPGALVITHAVHPSFGDCADMIRTNDVLERDLDGRQVPVADQLRRRAEIVSQSLPEHLIDTDQWPMPNRAEWLNYATAQVGLGVPALYYVDSIDNSEELIESEHLRLIAGLWTTYREEHGLL